MSHKYPLGFPRFSIQRFAKKPLASQMRHRHRLPTSEVVVESPADGNLSTQTSPVPSMEWACSNVHRRNWDFHRIFRDILLGLSEHLLV